MFASFWVSSRLTFESDERIIAVATDLGPSFQGFEDRVRHAKLPVYVTTLEDGPFNPLAGVRERAKAGGYHAARNACRRLPHRGAVEEDARARRRSTCRPARSRTAARVSFAAMETILVERGDGDAGEW